MSRFIALYIYIIFSVFCIIYDAFISNDINYVTYNRRNDVITVINVVGSLIWGLLIFLANYYNFNILAWVLLAITVVTCVSIIICDAIGIDLYLDSMLFVSNDNERK